MYKFIKKWSDYILNETLKTNDIDFVVDDIQSDLRLSGIDCDVSKKNNKIELIIYDFDKLYIIDETFDYINSLFIDRNGWFPSTIKLTNNTGKENELKYDENYLIENYNTLNKVIIIYEPKFDIVVNMPKKIISFEYSGTNNILKNGLFPKSKNKKSIHLDRIYLCSETDTKELDISIYKDPNYINRGYYITDNIKPVNIKIYDKE